MNEGFATCGDPSADEIRDPVPEEKARPHMGMKNWLYSLLCILSSPKEGGFSSSQSIMSSSIKMTIWHSLSPFCKETPII